MDASTLGYGATFASLSTREGLIALDKLFLAQSRRRTRPCMSACWPPAPRPMRWTPRRKATSLRRSGRSSTAFVAALFGIEDAAGRAGRAHTQRSTRSTPASACSCSARR